MEVEATEQHVDSWLSIKRHKYDESPEDFKTPNKKTKNYPDLMESVDLSDLSFSSYNDFILGDCTSFEDASQHVDPSITVDNPPLSFNSNSVQLFKDTSRLYKNEDSLNLDNLLNRNNDDYHRLVNEFSNYDFYHVFEFIDDDKNTQIEKKQNQIKNEKVSKKTKAIPIRKGRRYLPNFKQKVLEYAVNHTFKETASRFSINCNTITEWSRESERLSLQNKSTTSLPGTVSNYKTGTSVSKTDIILLNDDFSLETEDIQINEKDLPSSCNMRSDERFLKWIQLKRLEKTQLSRSEVYHFAMFCFQMNPPCDEEELHCMNPNAMNANWFVLWLRRFKKALLNSVKSNSETERYIMYPNNFKLEVALYAKLFTKNSVARVFNVPRRRVFDWFNRFNHEMDSSDQCDVNKEEEGVLVTADCDKNKNKNRDRIYVELRDWYEKKVEEGLSPSSLEIKAKAKEIFAANGINDMKFSEGWLQKFCKRCDIKLRHNGDDNLLLWILAQFDNNVSLSHQQITDKSSTLIGKKREFKGSKGWTLRFLKRHSKFLQFVPTIEDKLPITVNEKLNDFWKGFQLFCETYQINPNSIGCMDEIPISFNYPQDEKASNLPLLRKTGFENCQAVVILSATADGRVLPPTVVFKGDGPRQYLTEGDEEILICYQQDGLVDFNVLNVWIYDLWLNCMTKPNLLILDSFEPHCSPELKNQLVQENCILSVIPEGCSSQLQPLSVEITRTFQDSIKNEWKQLPASPGPHSSKNPNRCKCPDQVTILQWIRIAYQKIKGNPNSIIDGFKMTGLLK